MCKCMYCLKNTRGFFHVFIRRRVVVWGDSHRKHSVAPVDTNVWNMVLLKLLIFTLTFHELVVDLDARKICPKGQRITRSRDGCDVCPDDGYQDEQNQSLHCKPCARCDGKTGSYEKEKCTRESNTICQCRRGFVPYESDSSTCKCDIGFGLEHEECSKCKDGYFSSNGKLPCQKWKGCKCGVKMTGNNTTDVICNPEKCSDASNSDITPTTSNKLISLLTHHPHEGAPTQRMQTNNTATAAPGQTVSLGNRKPFHPSDTSATHTGMAFLLFGIIGLLVLTAVTCKLHITPQPAVANNDPLCRKPVEEIGEGSRSSLKLNLEED